MDKNRKVMFISSYLPPHLGGAENYVWSIAKGLSKKYKWNVVIVTTQNISKSITVKDFDGIKIYELPTLFTLSNTPINPLWYLYLKNIIKAENPDIVNAHAPVPFLADLAAKATDKEKFVLTYHDGSMIKTHSLFNFPIYIYEKFILKNTLKKAKTIICCSDFVRKDFLINYKNKSITINPGVDSVSTQDAAKSKLNILFVASLTKSQSHKGLDKLLRAIVLIKNKVNDCKLTVVGKGDALSDYVKTAKELGIQRNVLFKGAVYGNDLKKLFRKSDLFVLPTSKESFGMVIIEAMSQGTPVVASNIGGIPRIIKNGKEGLLIDPNDETELSDAVVRILKDRRLAKLLGKNGIKKVRTHYLWSHKITDTHNLFRKILN